MPRWLHVMRSRMPRGTAIWAGLCVLLALGLLTTLADYAALPALETREANSNGQRVIIDPNTGTVTGDAADGTVAAFEVSDDEPSEAIPSEPTDETVPQEKAAVIDGPALRTEPSMTPLPKMDSSRESIVAPPAPEITEMGKHMLPKRGQKDATPAKLYARLFQRQKGVAYVTFLVTDVGFNAALLSQIMKLPHEVTLAFSPYALDPKPQIELMHTAGFETWGMLPMQSNRYPQDDPGPLGIIGGQKETDTIARVKKVMSATLGAVGLVLAPDEALSRKPEFTAALKEIDARGLLLLSTNPEPRISEITKDAELQKIIRRADIVLDSTRSPAFIQSKLDGLKALAEEQKAVVVVLTARPQTLRILSDWLKTEALGDVQLAPLSSMFGPDAPPPPPEAPEESASGHGAPKKPAEKASGGQH